MKYEEYVVKKERIFNWVVAGGFLVLFLGMVLGLGAHLFAFLLAYGIVCSIKYVQFIDQHPDNNKICNEIRKADSWWTNLEWKEKLYHYRKNKGGIGKTVKVVEGR